MTEIEFSDAFKRLTGYAPLSWQQRLFRDHFDADADQALPNLIAIPTGLGKTMVIAIWLIALASGAKVPRRLVYVVNRRKVVDQTTEEAENFRKNLVSAGIDSVLRQHCAIPLPDQEPPLAISTIRGQFADNRQWSTDPCRPAIICGTVDMIGSRLLFSGYGVGFKSKPLQAGFLGQDTLFIHDEAHLEPAFQKLVESIAAEQERCREFKRLRVIELTATTRSADEPHKTTFALQPEDRIDPTIQKRIRARKQLVLTSAADDKSAPGTMAKIAAGYKDANAAVVVFVRTLEAAATIEKELQKTGRSVVLLTGTIRGKERDALVNTSEFARFLKAAQPGETVYLISTSAGEVGIDISADHMVCDLSTFESMAQRFGRVNRYGDRSDTQIDVVHPVKFDDKDKLAPARQATLALLIKLRGNASPEALGGLMSSLTEEQRQAAFAPPPTILPVTDILFDAWALTSIKGKLPGRPIVEPYLHGIREYELPETQVAWRDDVDLITDDLRDANPPQELLEDYPLKPHELLRDRSDRVFKHLEMLAKRHPDKPVWVVEDHEAVEVTTLEKLTNKQQKDSIEGCTVLLPPSAGGLLEECLMARPSRPTTWQISPTDRIGAFAFVLTMPPSQ